MALFDLEFIRNQENVLFLGPPGVGKTHLAIALATKACYHGFKVYFMTMDSLMRKLKESQIKHKTYLTSSLVVVDEVGYLLGITHQTVKHRHLSIVHFPKTPQILPCYSDRLHALFPPARFIHHIADRLTGLLGDLVEFLLGIISNPINERGHLPRGLADKMVHVLVVAACRPLTHLFHIALLRLKYASYVLLCFRHRRMRAAFKYLGIPVNKRR